MPDFYDCNWLSGAVLGVVVAMAKSQHTPAQCGPGPAFVFWNGLTASGAWYQWLDVNANKSFERQALLRLESRRACLLTPSMASGAARVQVDWADRSASQLFASPALLKQHDDWIRTWNPNARTMSGAVDECGWPAPAGSAPQHARRATCMYEDFAQVLQLPAAHCAGTHVHARA